MTEKTLKEAAGATPDPERSFQNLSTFIEQNPARAEEVGVNAAPVALLFGFSQFLANYCISNPDALFEALAASERQPQKEDLASALDTFFERANLTDLGGRRPSAQGPFADYMAAAREFKMRETLRITLRDILGKADLVDIMAELSGLADVLIEAALVQAKRLVAQIYGAPAEDAFSVIALGKLGGEELNFSSDVDLIYVYGTEIGETSGIRTAQGILTNRISSHEYYSKVAEALTRFLSMNTEEGFVYRVDLRLRPEGQRGNIALALRGYEIYYESWGRAWERAMLIRARPAAGEPVLGRNFLEMIRPFVYRKYLDFSSIEEIKNLKTRIDSAFKRADIKRGYGGIREIEFFAQALQLIYGGKEPLLRERSILKSLHRLLQKALIGQEDYRQLSENYAHYRTLEHRLQQFNNLQTHTVPSGGAELAALAKKMGFDDTTGFVADLERRRLDVRKIYDSLFSEGQKPQPQRSLFIGEELSDSELREYLAATGVHDIGAAIRNIRAINESTLVFQTLRGRKLLGEILPEFIEAALRSSMPDSALNRLHSFSGMLSQNESYLDIFRQDKTLIGTLAHVFAVSEYLSKMIVSRPRYLEILGWRGPVKKSRAALIDEIRNEIAEGRSINDVIRLVRQSEEIRSGLLFLQGRAGVIDLIKGLSRTAEAILSVSLDHFPELKAGAALIGFGKLGGREITFNSDLDLVFVCSGETPSEAVVKSAEKLLRLLVSYTREGAAYAVDTRLRPDGSKGPLVTPVERFAGYYSHAAFWELQALLKARPVAGDPGTGLSFLRKAKDVLLANGAGVRPADVVMMRDRILRELSREAEGYDIKLGPGGVEEIEFIVQFLQLSNCGRNPGVLVQGTLEGIARLKKVVILSPEDAAFLSGTYAFYRSLESYLRLTGDSVLKKTEEKLRAASAFMGFENTGEFIAGLETKRKRVRELFERFLRE